MDRVIFVRRIFARQLQNDLSTTGMAVNEIGDLFSSILVHFAFPQLSHCPSFPIFFIFSSSNVIGKEEKMYGCSSYIVDFSI